jgi:hypothetical protein
MKVVNYNTGLTMHGRPSLRLVEESLRAGDTGAVWACKDEHDVWQYIIPGERNCNKCTIVWVE